MQSVQREHMLVKVTVDNATRSQVLEAVNLFRARVVDVAPDALVIEVTGDSGKVAGAAARARALRHQGDRAVGPPRRSAAAARASPNASSRASTPLRAAPTRRTTQEEHAMAEIFYDKDADLVAHPGQEGRDRRLRLAGPRPRAEPARLGRRGRDRPQGRLEVDRRRPRRTASGARTSPTPPSGPTSS